MTPETEALELTPIDGGYRIRETQDHFIDVTKMMFNWRLVATPKDLPCVFDRGYCYIGTDIGTFLKAVLAGKLWDDPLNTDPMGWDKDATRNRYSEDYLAREDRARKPLVSNDLVSGYSQDQV